MFLTVSCSVFLAVSPHSIPLCITQGLVKVSPHLIPNRVPHQVPNSLTCSIPQHVLFLTVFIMFLTISHHVSPYVPHLLIIPEQMMGLLQPGPEIDPFVLVIAQFTKTNRERVKRGLV